MGSPGLIAVTICLGSPGSSSEEEEKLGSPRLIAMAILLSQSWSWILSSPRLVKFTGPWEASIAYGKHHKEANRCCLRSRRVEE
ncbi:unnamed protein product [Linum trigynum]|uniref:Uncharacterized protein n=1 Tax=Linum trigynum TaxID=586398 RepID=A0AAV2E1G5_9ROSI